MTGYGEKASDHCGMTLEEATRLAEINGERVVNTFCSMCGPAARCGIYAFVKDGRFVRASGMAECPINRGALCAKGLAAPQWVYSADRLKKPLLRAGEKGEGAFREIPWSEAIDILAEKLLEQKKQYGPESLAILSPARRSYCELLQRFLIAHGSPNYGHSGICFQQRAFCYMYTLGSFPQCDYRNTELILLWGRQPVFSGPPLGVAKELVAAKKRGAAIIAIKPSVEPDVSIADTWVPLRPGTDAALALSMIYVIINENLIDSSFVRDWCYGYEEIKVHIQQYPPEWAEQITGVPAGQICQIARLYAGTKAALIDIGNGVEHAPSSSDAIRAVAILMAITGHLDRPGCNLLSPSPMGENMPVPKGIKLYERYTKDMVEKLVGPEFPAAFQPFLEGTSSAYYRIFESVLTQRPYPIRTIIAPGTQPSVSTRGSKQVVEALKKLDFYVVIDVARTADMQFADLVLPTATPYETDHPFELFGNWIMARNKVVEPLGDYKSIYELFLELGVRMGYGSDFWGGDITAFQNFQLEHFQMSINQLRTYPTGRTYEPSSKNRKYENFDKAFGKKRNCLSGGAYLPQGKVALVNTSFQQQGFSPLPQWREPPESLTGTPELKEKYPLILSDYHTSDAYSAGWLRNVPILRELHPDPVLHIHPDTAAERNIREGDWVRVESPRGWLKVKAELYPGIRPDTVMLLHGWWQGCPELKKEDMPLLDGGANVNVLYSVDPERAYDPLITAMSSQTLVEVRKFETSSNFI